MVTYAISIRNTSPMPLVLSDAVVNAKEIVVKMKEIEPGRRFSVSVTLPKGFDITKDEHIELNIKASSATIPVIKVPIL